MYLEPAEHNKIEVLSNMRKMQDLLNDAVYQIDPSWDRINEIVAVMNYLLVYGPTLPSHWNEEYNKWLDSWFEESFEDSKAQRELTHQL